MNTLKISYKLALLGFVLQFLLLGYGSFSRADIVINGPYDILIGLIWTLIKGIPWLVLVPGLILKSARIMAWMSYVCLVYFIIWILAAFGEQQSGLGSLGVAVTLIQFAAAAYFTRLNKQPK